MIILIIVGSVLGYLIMGCGTVKILDMVAPDLTRDSRNYVEVELVAIPAAILWPITLLVMAVAIMAVLYGKGIAKILGRKK